MEKGLTFCANYLLRRQFAELLSAVYWGEYKKRFPNLVCWNFNLPGVKTWRAVQKILRGKLRLQTQLLTFLLLIILYNLDPAADGNKQMTFF